MRVQVIVNPFAGYGRAGKLWPQIERRLREIYPVLQSRLTVRPREATDIARQSIIDGVDLILAMGGDGTVNEVVNGFFDGARQISTDAILGIIPIGTGKDFIRSLGLPSDPFHAIQKISAAAPRPADVGRLSCSGLDGRPVVRYFINVADLGIGGAVVDRINGSSKRLGGFLTHLNSLLVTLASYKNVRVRLRIDDAVDEEMVVNSINVANGQFLGGGMWLAPDAKIDDGWFDVVIIGNLKRVEALMNIPLLYRGKLAQHPKVKVVRGRRIEATSAQDVLLEADGEGPGKLPAVFEIVPSAVKLLV
jgi:YegS/Rv2252/BmrU family lipid kinase